jgi:hypothetical protein
MERETKTMFLNIATLVAFLVLGGAATSMAMPNESRIYIMMPPPADDPYWSAQKAPTKASGDTGLQVNFWLDNEGRRAVQSLGTYDSLLKQRNVLLLEFGIWSEPAVLAQLQDKLAQVEAKLTATRFAISKL